MLTHYLIKEEITKNASRLSEVRRVTKARYAFSFSSKDGKTEVELVREEEKNLFLQKKKMQMRTPKRRL